MLLEISGSPDPDAFRKTDIYRRCREAGIIPADSADLEAAVRRQHPDGGPSDGDVPDSSKNSGDPNQLDAAFAVSGMWCPACAWVIEETLLGTEGVFHARCLFATDRLQVAYDPRRVSPVRIADRISRLGYGLTEPGEDRFREERRREFIRFGLSAFLTMNVMMLSFSLYSGFFFSLPEDAVRKLSWPIAVMATAVLLYGGARVHRRGWRGILTGRPGMESLIAIGADCSWALSMFNLISGSIHLYFDTAAMLITLVLLGKMLEQKAKDRVQEDLSAFFSLSPKKVRLCTDDFPEGRYGSVDALGAGGLFRVDAGEVVPADGVVVHGGGAVNESSITGEPTALAKTVGDRLVSGTRIETGSFKARAERVGRDSTLGQMVGIMEQALGRKTGLEGKTDRLLRGFVPVIVLLAAATGFLCILLGMGVEAALIRGITVVVISCPCALGIAIPLARVAGISLANRNGILVREFGAFEAADRIDTIVFDKTGTLTEGRWRLLDVLPSPGVEERWLIAAAAGLESVAEHPVAMEIRKAADVRGISPVEFTQIDMFENGVAGIADGERFKIGSHGFLEDWMAHSDEATPTVSVQAHGLSSRVYLGRAGRLEGLLVFGDRYKETALESVSRLKARGCRVILVSGDGQTATETAGEGLGIPDRMGERRPVDKAEEIEALRAGGRSVAMVGDGVNDAPALAAADIGMAVYAGSPLSREAADLTLMRGDPLQVLSFLDLAVRVNEKVRQNLFFTFVYNGVGIPLAMSGLLTPLVAVTAMLLSSLSVTGNTLLLMTRDRRH
jgi:heavy metal translocating P-type ATPase